LAFLDDDVVVSPTWLRATHDFFANSPFDVKQGAIHIPPAFAGNEEVLTLLKRYRTIYYLMQPWPRGHQVKSLNAANLAVRRSLLDKTGLFDERLGPGASGTSMDSEFGDRLQRVGGRIGYEPQSVVYHHVDWRRLTDEYFRWRNEAEGRSNLIYKNIRLPNILYNGGLSLIAFGWYWLWRSKRKKYRMKGRCFRYAAMLKVRCLRKTQGLDALHTSSAEYNPTHHSL
jgi:GT2 family glycosyltransferase